MEETVAHFVIGCMVLEDVMEQFAVTCEDVLEEILLFREKTEEKAEWSIGLLEEMWKKRREMD